MRSTITLFEDQYKFYKELKSKKLLVAFVEYMFEDIEPEGLNGIEKTVFNSLKNRMEKSKKIQERNSKGGKQSSGGGRPRNASSELDNKNSQKTTKKQPKVQNQNNEEEDNNTNVLLCNISSYEDIYSAYYGKNKGIDEKTCNRLINTKLEQGITLEDIRKGMVLYNCECRIKQEYTFVKKFETWIKEFQPMDESQLDETLYGVIKSFINKRKTDEKFGQSSPAKTLIKDLKETFGEEKVKAMWKQANTINLTFT